MAEAILAELRPRGEADLALEVAARFPVELLARVLDLPRGDVGDFARRYWAMQRGIHWEPVAEEAGRAAIAELTAYFAPLVEARRADPGDDLVSAIVTLELDSGPATAEDVVVTLLEGDHETLHGSLANLWYLLLGDREQLDLVTGERRMVKLAYLEALRHSPPVLAAHRYARHEVERFGRLLPKGAQVICSAGAANRDPRAFPNDPDAFIVQRKDLCQREPRGQYRADGLPTGIAFGLGPPSKHPALPEDRPRSLVCHLPRHRGDGDEPPARRAPRSDAGAWCQPDAAVAARRRDAHLLAPAGDLRAVGLTVDPQGQPVAAVLSSIVQRLSVPSSRRARSTTPSTQSPCDGLADHVGQHAGRGRVVGGDQVVAGAAELGVQHGRASCRRGEGHPQVTDPGVLDVDADLDRLRPSPDSAMEMALVMPAATLSGMVDHRVGRARDGLAPVWPVRRRTRWSGPGPAMSEMTRPESRPSHSRVLRCRRRRQRDARDRRRRGRSRRPGSRRAPGRGGRRPGEARTGSGGSPSPAGARWSPGCRSGRRPGRWPTAPRSRSIFDAVLDEEVLVGLGGAVLQHGVVGAVLGLVGAGGREVDLGVAPAGQVAQVAADGRRAPAEVEVVPRPHQAVVADAGAGGGVAVALAVVVHVGEAAQQVAVLVAEGADAQVGRRSAPGW